MMTQSAARTRRGTFIPILALTVTGLFAFVALAVDLGMLTIGHTNCQNASDTAALAGARILSNRSGAKSQNDRDTAVATIKHLVPRNSYVNAGFANGFSEPPDSNIQIGQYLYNTATERFQSDFVTPLGTGQSYTAVRVTTTSTQPTIFARVLGINSMPNSAVATAVHRPRDVAIILDFSVSMKFGSMGQWPSGMGSSSGTTRGLLSPDPNYPQFAHYGRYTQYSTTNALTPQTGSGGNAEAGAPSSRPNPLYHLSTFILPSGEVHAPNNFTMETPGGPPVVFDFRFDPSNRKTPATKVSTVNVNSQGLGLWNAFHRWIQTTPTDTPDITLPYVDQSNLFKYTGLNGMRPTVQSEDYSSSPAAVFRTFNWAEYDAFDLDSVSGPVPAPDTFGTQDAWPDNATNTVPYVGDVFPGKKGFARPTTWDPGVFSTTASGPAVTAAELLGWGNVPFATGVNIGSGLPPDRSNTTLFPTGTGNNGYKPTGTGVNNYAVGSTTPWNRFRDATWERYGYDLRLDLYSAEVRMSGGATWDPRWDWRINTAWASGGTGNGAWVHNRKKSNSTTFVNPPDAVSFRPSVKTPTAGRISTFNGYSMGPGYWGKTFWMWPPDPRFGVRNPNTGATTLWPDVTRPVGGTISSGSTSELLRLSDPAFSTHQSTGAATWTAAATPVPMCDWRRRFFIPTGASEITPSTWFDPEIHDIDGTLFEPRRTADANGGRGGPVLRTTGYQINYRAVLAWLKSGPQVLPTNLRAGRIVYYTSIPNDCDNPNSDPDKRFWRDYIDFVLGYNGMLNYDPNLNLAGSEWKEWPENGRVYFQATDKLSPDWANQAPTGTGTQIPSAQSPALSDTDPRAYQNYSNNPNRPRAHFWFGPMSMLDFLACRSAGGNRRLWWSGTVREAQTWQLKAAVFSALEDIRINHPNDYCGLGYFANFLYSTPRVPMGQSWADLKNALFYNGPTGNGSNATNLLATLRYESPATYPADTTTEHYPFNPTNLSGTFGGNNLNGVLPNANGGTDPNTGLALGFNLLSSSTNVAATHTGLRGRRGSAKIVIFETDGVPNAFPAWSLTGTGTNTRYQNSGAAESYPVPGLVDQLAANGLDISFPPFTGFANAPDACNRALAVTQRIVAPATTTGTSGFSLPNSPARVYPIGFGDLFEGYDGTLGWSGTPAATNAVKFLLRVGQAGNTLPLSPTAPMPQELIIAGPYQNRINNLRNVLERIMQSGVQVTLIE